MNLLEEAVAVVGVNPVDLLGRLTSGRPDGIVALARTFEEAGLAAREAYERDRRAHAGVAAGFTNDGAPVLDAARHDREAWQLLGQGGDDLERTAAVLKRTVGALETAQATGTAAVDRMIGELNQLASGWNLVRATAGPAALAALIARAVAVVTTARTAVQGAIDEYDGRLRRDAAELTGRFPADAGAPAPVAAPADDGGLLGDVRSFFGGALEAGTGFAGGVVEGAEEAVAGLGALVGYGDGEFSWGTAGTAWAGLATFVGAAALYAGAPQVAPSIDKYLTGGRLGGTLEAAGKSLIAYDLWGTDPARAAGKTTFNIVSAIVGTKGAGAGLRAGGLADDAGRLASGVSGAARAFPDDAAAAAYGARHWNDHVDALPAEQRAALHDYSREVPAGGPTFREINGALRGQLPDTPEVRAHVADIDAALASRPLPEPLPVTRGTGIDHFGVAPEDLVGQTVREPGYLSTSLGSPAAGFADQPAVLHLTAPEGTPAVWMERASAFGASERELLLGRGLEYRVTGVRWEGEQWHIQGEILPPR